MEIFCYDLMLAERWAAKRPGSIDLIHDSNLFADVDDRQIAAALELAADKANKLKFQYICTFNSDKLPLSEFSKGFDIASFTRLRLTDETEDGGLLGIRLPSAATRAPRSSSKTFDLLQSSRAEIESTMMPAAAVVDIIAVASGTDFAPDNTEEEEYGLFNQNATTSTKKLVRGTT
jgi:hypothetical protein